VGVIQHVWSYQSQPQALPELNQAHPLAGRLLWGWVGGIPFATIDGSAVTPSGVTYDVAAGGRIARIGSYSGSSIISLPNSDLYRLSNRQFTLVARVLVTSNYATYKQIWCVRDGSTLRATFFVGFDAGIYDPARLAFNAGSAGNDLLGEQGTIKFGQFATYAVEVYAGGSGQMYVDGQAITTTNTASQLIPSSTIQPSLGNRQSGGRALDGDIEYVFAFDGSIGPEMHRQIHAAPYSIFAHRVYVPVTAGGSGLPTLSDPTFVPGSLTSTGFRPRVTITF
jgi:hypothetical protein